MQEMTLRPGYSAPSREMAAITPWDRDASPSNGPRAMEK